MAQAPPTPAPHTESHSDTVSPNLQAHPVTPGKVAMWLFLATEVMFFTGLIGTYIVLRTGSPMGSYSELYSPGTDLKLLTDSQGVILKSVGSSHEKVLAIFRKHHPDLDEHQAEHALEWVPNVVANDLPPDEAEKLVAELKAAGAGAETRGLMGHTFDWPRPYDALVNPLSIDLTAFNTFILICSSVTMVLSLSAIQRGDKLKFNLWLLATVCIGSVFLSIQVYEYYQLMFGHHYPLGISPDGHFRPSRSVFASCFFTMTGFHGAHVAGGIIGLATLLVISLVTGKFTRANHSPIELFGLYWHFVDLVWILLFTVVYLI